MRRVLSRLAWMTYDHLGGIIALNLAWAAASTPWLALSAALVALASRVPESLVPSALLVAALGSVDLVIFSPATLLLFLAARSWVEDRRASPVEILAEARRLFFRAQAVGLMKAASTVVLTANFLFYRRLGGWVGAILGGAMLWFLLGAFLVSLYLLPWVVAHRDTGSAWDALRQSCQLVLLNPRVTLGLMALVLIVSFASLALVVPLLLGAVPVLALMVWLSFQFLLERHALVPPRQSETRSWRDLLKPWETR